MKHQRQDWLTYFRTIADEIRLRDWDFLILDELPNIGAMASIFCVTGRKLGSIRLSEGFLTDTEINQRYFATHELVHCHIALQDAIAEMEIDENHIGSYSRASEYGVDAMAQALAQFMPMPSEILGS